MSQQTDRQFLGKVAGMCRVFVLPLVSITTVDHTELILIINSFKSSTGL